jgi:hypothetical protein
MGDPNDEDKPLGIRPLSTAAQTGTAATPAA